LVGGGGGVEGTTPDTEDTKIDRFYIGLAEKVFLGGRVWGVGCGV